MKAGSTFLTRFIVPVFRLLPAVVCLSVPLRAQARGYTLAEIQDLVSRRYSEVRILDLAKQRCLGFTLSPQAVTQLRRAGASAQLVRDLASVCSRVPAERATPARVVGAPPSVDDLISRGDRLRWRGDAADALPLYRQAVSREPANDSAHFRVGLALRDQRLYAEAAAAFSRAAELRPGYWLYHSAASSAYSKVRQFREVEVHARAAVRLSNGSPQEYFELGVALAELGRLNEAKDALSTAVRNAPPGWVEAQNALDRVEGRSNAGTVSTRAFDIPAISANVDAVRFFEGPDGQRVYRYRFRRDSARFISYEVQLRHPAPSQPTNFNLVAVYLRSDGSPWVYDTLVSSVITSGPSYHIRSRGFATPVWPTGTYQVDFLYQGERIASSEFELVNARARAGTADLPAVNGRVVGVRFFEAGATPPSEINRSYRYRFSAGTTRYLYATVELAQPVRLRVDLPVQVTWYAPDGRVVGRTAFSDPYVAPGNVTSFPSLTSVALGYAEPGKWAKGRYRVDVMSGARRITSGWFDIY
ncbi:MAG TPA: tetratricopeptide repeat protein [Longimicrobium sp.]|nr:tetratricopeptide repeat protein [Longimicrobium sp.]